MILRYTGKEVELNRATIAIVLAPPLATAQHWEMCESQHQYVRGFIPERGILEVLLVPNSISVVNIRYKLSTDILVQYIVFTSR